MVSRESGPLRSLTRRQILKFPWLCWLTSTWAGSLFTRSASAIENSGYTEGLKSGGQKLSLNGTWSLTFGSCPDAPKKLPQSGPPGDWPTISATVPGNVEIDMIAAGYLEPLEKGNRVYQALNLEYYQWWYRRTFQFTPKAPGARVDLVFDGLDCLGTIWLNGKLVGQAANMLIPHRFNVSGLLREGEANELVVRIDPAVPAGFAFARSAWEKAGPGRVESLHIRKAPHMYGWDIMPRLVSAGLWRDVRLEEIPPYQISDVHWVTSSVDVERKRAAVSVDWQINATDRETGKIQLEIELARNGKVAFRQAVKASSQKGHQDITLDDVNFWWPRGYGSPALYEAKLILRNGEGAVVDQHQSRIGIRTIKLIRSDIVTEDRPGNFEFFVNDVPIFVKGTNWVPLDALHSRDTRHLDDVFPMLVDLNCNMVRCWGGNVYEQDRFFDLCDESGILVWQDFAMADAAYPQDDAFANAIVHEVETVVRRLRNHASIALWCGNNENDNALVWLTRPGPPVDPNRDRISREVIPGVLMRLDPNNPYQPSSPYHSPQVFAAGNKLGSMPEVHLWGPRGYFKSSFYTDVPAHFISEIGYSGCPSRSSLEQMFDPEYVHPWIADHQWNDEWQTKCGRARPSSPAPGRLDVMTKQVGLFFDAVPDDLDNLVLASQICQAEGLKFAIENWRQQKEQKHGILWWNLRDGWPIVSGAIVDFYNTKKLAYHYIQRSQRDVQVICCEAAQGWHGIAVTNDTLLPARGQLKIWNALTKAKLLDLPFEVESNGIKRISQLAHPTQPEMWHLEWNVDGVGTFATHYLATADRVNLAQYKRWMESLPF